MRPQAAISAPLKRIDPLGGTLPMIALIVVERRRRCG